MLAAPATPPATRREFPMSEQYLFECACERTARNSVPHPPAGWSLVDGKAICDDCLQAGDGRNGTISSPPPTAPALATAGLQPPTSIRLRSGGYLDLSDPDCSIVQPIDIASGLRQARYSAQTRSFFTIAQHSVLVLRLVEEQAHAVGGVRGIQLRRCALLHDAAEAFIHDITRPLKILLPDYRRVEAVLEHRLAQRFDLEWTSGRKEIVKAADFLALAIEKRDLIGDADRWPVLAQVDVDTLSQHRITRAWHPDEAEDRFLAEFNRLWPTEERKAA